MDKLLKNKPFVLENEPEIRNKILRHIIKNRNCIDPSSLDSGLKSLCKFKETIPIDYRQSESKLNRTVCEYLNQKKDKLKRKFNTNTTM